MGIELRLLINKGQFKATDKPLQHFGQNHFSYLLWEKTGVNNQIRLGRNQNNFPYQLHFSVNMTSTDESVNKMWYILTLECYLAIKRNEILIHTTWITLESIMLGIPWWSSGQDSMSSRPREWVPSLVRN